jgi:hypothetical protein
MMTRKEHLMAAAIYAAGVRLIYLFFRHDQFVQPLFPVGELQVGDPLSAQLANIAHFLAMMTRLAVLFCFTYQAWQLVHHINMAIDYGQNVNGS